MLSPCLTWASDSARGYDEELSNHEKRDKGTLFHALMDCYYKGIFKLRPAADKFPDVWPWYETAALWSKQHLEPRCTEIHSEIYVGYNFKSGYVHTDATVHDRQYPKMPGFVPGTADLVCILGDGSLYVGDWKTGSGTGADKQLLTLACGLRKVYLKPDGTERSVVLAALYAGETDDRRVHPVEWTVSESDLLSHEHAMAERLAGINKKNKPVVGIHCSQLYCNHLAYCSGIRSIVTELADREKKLPIVGQFNLTDMPISDEEAGFTMERIYAAKRQYEYMMAGIKKYIVGGGRAIAGDFEYKQTTTGFRWVKRT